MRSRTALLVLCLALCFGCRQPEGEATAVWTDYDNGVYTLTRSDGTSLSVAESARWISDFIAKHPEVELVGAFPNDTYGRGETAGYVVITRKKATASEALASR